MSEDTPFMKDPHIRKGIITSVIASLIIILLIQPVLRLVWSVILTFGTRFFNRYINHIYTNAAFGHRNYVDILFMIILFGLFSGISVALTLELSCRILRPKSHPLKPGKHHLLFIWIWCVIFHVMTIYCFIPPYADLQLNTSFRQRLTVLAPKLTEQEEEELEAAWALMKTRSDYKELNLRMEQVAESNNIALPKLLWK